MGTDQLDRQLTRELAALAKEGRAKPEERIITGVIPAAGNKGPRVTLKGSDKHYLRMNSNAYLDLSLHPKLIAAADKASQKFGTGPGSVRFIDGTSLHHHQLEQKIAAFLDKPAARIFNSAYTANCGLALSIAGPETFWIGDELNHNSIIRSMRISNVPKQNRLIYAHNDMDALENCLEQVPEKMKRVIVIFDGVFSMRGDCAPVDKITTLCQAYENRFKDGIITIIDDSHGIGTYGKTGRGTCEFCSSWADIIVGTFGKAFGVNGGFVAASATVAEAVRQKADTYIYTNSLSAADCAAAVKAIEICDSKEGSARLKQLNENTRQFRNAIDGMGLESIAGPHAVVPLMIRNTPDTKKLVDTLFENKVLVVGLTFPVVPKGSECIRFQLNAGHTPEDIEYVVELLKKFA